MRIAVQYPCTGVQTVVQSLLGRRLSEPGAAFVLLLQLGLSLESDTGSKAGVPHSTCLRRTHLSDAGPM